MPDPYPKSYDELVAENEILRADVARLEQSASSLQSSIVARDSEISQLRRPKPAPRVLDPDAEDSFQRPARFR